MIRLGVVGVGKFGHNHARILGSNGCCDFRGIYDKNKKRALEVSQMYNFKKYSSLKSLLQEIDAVVIVVNTTYHYEIAKQALQRGIHVFLEKPITAEMWEAQELIELAEKENVILQVGHIERFNPVILAIADKVHNPMFAECHRIAPFNPRNRDVPVVLDLMIHDIDLILSFVASKVQEIRASGAKIITNNIDIANARLEFENGAVANVTASRISMKRSRQLRFFQKDAYFSIDFQNMKVKHQKKSAKLYKIIPKLIAGNYEGIDPKDVVDTNIIDASNPSKDSLTVELEAFINSVKTGKPPLVDGKAGSRALNIALKIVNIIKETS
ncbi:MAG: Gfo/Idh/MocA family oxidoreductase [Candidatus Cloacimonadota bacterium]|nr:Gfo/Idh/MocA family oxidoreductase [Candidatus Cloacimonadota bacterium]